MEVPYCNFEVDLIFNVPLTDLDVLKVLGVVRGLPYPISLQYQSKPLVPLSLQFVCNQDNHALWC